MLKKEEEEMGSAMKAVGMDETRYECVVFVLTGQLWFAD